MLVRNGVASGEAKGKGRVGSCVTAVWGRDGTGPGPPDCSADRWASDGQGGKECTGTAREMTAWRCAVGPEGEMSWAMAMAMGVIGAERG